MSERKINLEEIANKFGFLMGISIHSNSAVSHRKLKDAMKEACRQVLELAAENAETINKEINRSPEPSILVQVIDKQSILNTINQIE